ncbi:MAG TPA: response regulator [Deltaproteobacteria bacterium]|nr:response regulator [Deltaproteobacteria bacterium]
MAWLMALTMVLLAVVIGVSGHAVYTRYRAVYQEEIERQLEAISELKVGQIEKWRQERASDATGMYLNTIVRQGIEKRLKGDRSPGLKRELEALFTYFGSKPGYKDHYLLWPDGGIDLTSGPSGRSHSTVVARFIGREEALFEPGEAYFIDFHPRGQDGPLELDVLTPVMEARNGGHEILGYILLEIDPGQVLFPLVESWPVPSSSAEALLVRRNGSQVEYLNSLKHGDAAGSMRPAQSPDLPAAMALSGKSGLVEGRDYRGVEVVAFIRQVPDSPWHLIVKKDAEEVYAPIRNAGRVILLVSSLALLAFGGAGMSLLMKWRANHYRYLGTLESQKAELFERLESLMQNAGDAIVVFGGDLVIREANRHAIGMYGYTRAELIGMSVEDLSAPEAREGVAHDLVNLRGRLLFETNHVRRDGTVFPVEVSVASMVIDGGRCYQAIVRDITERKQAEAELLSYRAHLEELVKDRTAELEDRNRELGEEIAERVRAEEEKEKVEAQLVQAQKIEALGRFAGGIAHDLNNALYPVIINTEMLLEEAQPGTDLHEILSQNLQAAYRQRDLVKQILSFSRQGAQKLRPVRMVPLLAETLDLVRSSLPSTIELRRSIDAPTDTFMGDASQIGQVIVNLCRNAADALASQQGVIEVVLTNVRLDSLVPHPGLKPGDYLVLEVRDTGGGMSGEVMHHIFDPFFTTKEVGEGSGMGLSVVDGILKKHGGAVTVQSEEGKGSLFTVYLPVHGDGARSPAVMAGTREHGRESILLIDDEDMVLSSLNRALEKYGYRVSAMKDPLEALELFSRDPGRFDLVITDLTMPRMNGLDLGKRLRDIEPGVPIILCTGFSETISREEVLSNGFKGLLQKPAGAGDLKEAVRNALQAGEPG